MRRVALRHWLAAGRRTPRRLRLAFAVTGVAFLLGMVPLYILNRYIVTRAAPRIVKDAAAVPPRHTAIVLGAFVGASGPSDVLEDRLATALELFRLGKVQRILVTGDHGGDDYDEVNPMRRWLVDRGVPSAIIFMDHAGFRTLDSMERAAQVFLVSDAVIVTQRFHLARSLFLADAAGLDAIGVVADRRRYEWEDHYARREFLARALGWIDVKLLKRQARYGGPSIPITGLADETHDAATR